MIRRQYKGRLATETPELARLMADGWRVKIMLDGAEQNFCRMADPAAGVVERFKSDDSGIIIPDGSDEFITERVAGKVEIFIEKEARA